MLEKLKGYQGKYILPLGKPFSFVSGWETETEYFCERITFFESTKKSHSIRAAMVMSIKKDEWKFSQEFYMGTQSNEKLLDGFVEDQGLRMVEADIFGVIDDHFISKGLPYNGIIELQEVHVASNIFLLRRIFPEQVHLLKTHTKSNKLKELIDITSSFGTSSYTEK